MAEQTNASQRLEQNLAGLEHSLRTLRRDLDALAGRVGEVEGVQSNQVDEVDGLQARLDEVIEAVNDQHDLFTDVHAEVSRLASRMDWIEHHLRRVADLETADLDHPDDGAPDLIEQIQLGLDADSALLGSQQRADLEARCANFTELQREKLRWDHRLVELSRTFADEPVPGADRLGAAEAFGEAAEQSDALGEKLRLASPRYRSDRDRLARDDDERERAQPVVEAGHEARAELQDRMRDRIELAVRDREPLPAWFTAVFGYGPPADESHWLDTAAEVLVYRLAHGIEDPTAALGDLPDSASPARRRWRDELAAQLATVHHAPTP